MAQSQNAEELAVIFGTDTAAGELREKPVQTIQMSSFHTDSTNVQVDGV